MKNRIIYAKCSCQGTERKINQDAILARSKGKVGLFLVSDGMGGHEHGECASGLIQGMFDDAWESIRKLAQNDWQQAISKVKSIICDANHSIYEQYNQNQVCGATVIVLLISDGCYAIFSVGDSRIYSYADGKVEQMTVDDVWDNLFSIHQSYSENEIDKDAKQGQLTQAVGTQVTVDVNISSGRMQPGQMFLLCSDGIYKYMDAAWLENWMEIGKKKFFLNGMVKLICKEAVAQGSGDDRSVVLVRSGNRNRFFF
jgi:serine/threonine protein phosphatase PrpC